MDNIAKPDLQDRMMSKFIIDGDCWVWTDCKTDRGYGRIQHDGKARRAHRVMYELFIGELIDGLTIDHLCSNRSCINPDHLEQVTILENTLRGKGPSAINAQKTECVAGHEFTDENTYWSLGMRNCKTCKSINGKINYWRKKEMQNVSVTAY